MQYEQVKELINIFEQTDLNDMEVKLGDTSLKLSRGKGGSAPEEGKTPIVITGASAPAAATIDVSSTSAGIVAPKVEKNTVESTVATGDKVVTAPIVGTFYQASAPDKPAFVKVGDTISKGDVVCIIEAMKFMNEVNSDVEGTITEILVEDGQFVEYGQELFRLK